MITIHWFPAFLLLLAAMYLGRHFGRKEGREEVKKKFSIMRGGR